MQKPQYVTAALITSLMGVVSCCAPIGILAAVLALLSLRSAKELGLKPPVAGVVALVLGLLSIAQTIGVYAWYRADQAAKSAQAAQATSRAEAGRREEVLSPKTACALAEAYLMEHHATAAKTVTCEGRLHAQGPLASLADVKLGDDRRYTVCFARVDQWYPAAAIAWGECPSDVPGLGALPQAEDARSLALRAAFSQVLRDSQRSALQSLAQRLVDAANRGADEGPHTCPTLAPGEAPVLDALLVSDEGTEKGWDFLTTRALRPLGQEDAPLEDLQKAGERLDTTVIVLVPEDRALPQKAGANSFEPGVFEGALVLVDVRSARPLCAVPFEFESSESIKTTKVGFKLGPKVNVGGGLEEDFHKNFGKALDATLERATHGQLKAQHSLF